MKLTTLLTAAILGLGLAGPALAQDTAHEAKIEKQSWTFAGLFGRYDETQLQRGFQVFREVCANCHSARLLAFRNLSEPGGPGFTEGQVKELAAQYETIALSVEGGTRKALPSDHWPSPFATELDARASNGGALPPDMSVLAKARSVEPGFPDWVFNYFTTYSEGGPDYIHALLNGYQDPPPDGFELPEGKYYNTYFPGHAIGMPPPLSDEQVTYAADANGQKPPETVEQYSRDVSAFLMWMAEPHLAETKSAGFRTLLFLILFSVLMYLVKNAVWRKAH
jgi:ubiquinol-cytochrome c reductase cytochrome c1 subunit